MRLLTALVLAAPVAAGAATLDLRAAVDVALRQNPDLAAVQAQIDQARAGIRQADGARLPRIVASAGVARSDDALNAFGMKLSQRRATFNDFGAGQFNPALPGVLGIAPDNLNHPAAVSDFNTRIEADMPLYTAGKIDAYAAQAKAMLRAAQAGDQAARQNIIAHVLQAYDGVHAARQYQAVAAQALQAAQSAVDLTEKMYRAGVVVRSDVLSAQVRLEDVKLQQRQADDMVAQALDGLHVVLGMPLREPLDVGPAVEVTMPEGTPDGWMAQAEQNNPQLQALRHQVEAAGAKVDAARADLYPQIGAMARVDTHDPNAGFGAHSYTIGAQLNWTVFDAGITRGAIDQAEAARRELQARVQSAQAQLDMQLRDAWRQALAADARLAARELAVRDAEEAARIESRRYADGVGLLVQLQAAQAQLDKARADRVLAASQRNEQRAALRLALGRLGVDAARPLAVAQP